MSSDINYNFLKNQNSNHANKKYKILAISLSVILLTLFGGWWVLYNQKPNNTDGAKSNGSSSSSGNVFFSFDLVKPVFAQVEAIANFIKPAIPYQKVQISEIDNLQTFVAEDNLVLNENRQQALQNNGFFLAANNIIQDQSGFRQTDDFVDMYDAFDGNANKYLRNADDSVFITSDMALHLYHVLIDRSVQAMEEKKFQPMLRAMTEVLFTDAVDKYNTTTDTVLKESYQRLAAYYLIPLVILDAGSQSPETELQVSDYPTFAQYLQALDEKNMVDSANDLHFALTENSYGSLGLSDETYALAKTELELIQTAKGKSASPLFTPLRPEFENDYSQFKPRSHYTKNDVLKSYFIAMMWYGRMGFPLTSPELTREALLITGQINSLKVNDVALAKMWSDMNVVIDFFVGEQDDLTAYQYSDMIKKVYGAQVSDSAFADENLLNEFTVKAKQELPAPKIVSEVLAVFDNGGQRNKLLADIKQFRFMGQRFTPDAYIINNLTQGAGTPEPETGQLLPSMPTALMPLRVLAPDNQTIGYYFEQWVNDPTRIQKQNRQSDKVIVKAMNKLITEFAGYSAETWTQNIYWSWLDIFKPLLAGYGEGYPYFMQSNFWAQKNLGTVLGSFTELKHDTLLYAKQSYAELGAGAPDNLPLPPTVKGYVEPDLNFWNKIIALTEMTQTGLKDRDFFPQDFEYKYQAFLETSKFFKSIAEQELQNKVISDEDFEKLRTTSATLRRIVEALPGQELSQKDKRAGIIADIHTDALKEEVLYEATGKPYIMYVAVKDINGTRLTMGAVYNHYEFAHDMTERLSDEDWQAQVYENKSNLPAADVWTTSLVK